MKEEENYWTERYVEKKTGWDIGYPSTPIKTYVDQLQNKALQILIPGAGNAYEAEYLWKAGFKNVHILDISEVPLKAFKKRNPDFPDSNMHQADFFEFKGQYDLIIEQTFFCSFVPTDTNRKQYAKHMASLLQPNGKLVGLWFDIPLTGDMIKRPFGGNKELYTKYLSPYFKTITFDQCYNSIPPRQGNELFGIFQVR
ncbi:class I SAM-dependent methyltransferase [Maribacter sp. Hel_I_7]|uniref:class I SAM-dependent methyltransferase n=1 Tax=Maribacter sp. Hel_I_7 TaxID=1249997 RepID=UPI00055B58AC|nr:class I SAM-dependent methyltransferase [Maribacter sp. Hel_I_7]